MDFLGNELCILFLTEKCLCVCVYVSVCADIYACLEILPTVEVCGGWSGMKTSSWEGNLNVMLNTFKNIIQMTEKFSFMTLETIGNQ